jgi:GTP-binding protein
MGLPVVVIVGAPNVGKSTLFNRLVGWRRAIVTDEPGMTRDRLYGVVREAPRPFRVVDTGGIDPGSAAPFARDIERQAEAALDEGALALFVVDARAGITALDRELASRLRRRPPPLLLVANKVDSDAGLALTHELHELGLGPPYPISAEHGLGIDELVEEIAARLGPAGQDSPEPGEPAAIRVAIVGRPNVGKSSIVNRLVGAERVLVSEIPGTTRDSVDTELVVGERRYVLVDTAGLRRSGRVERGPERFSVQRARRNIEDCDVAVLVLDATEELAAQDTHVAGYILEAHRPMVVALNKWDLVPEREEAAKRWRERVRRRLQFAKEVPIVYVSALTGQRLLRILDDVDAVYAAAGQRVPTVELNRWLQGQLEGRPGAPAPGALKLYYATQTGVRPPRFLLFCNDPKRVHFSFRRRLENSLREAFGFGAAPLRLEFRGRRKSA